eukprot:3020488-Prymnesium_polylepis.1
MHPCSTSTYDEAPCVRAPPPVCGVAKHHMQARHALWPGVAVCSLSATEHRSLSVRTSRPRNVFCRQGAGRMRRVLAVSQPTV